MVSALGLFSLSLLPSCYVVTLRQPVEDPRHETKIDSYVNDLMVIDV